MKMMIMMQRGVGSSSRLIRGMMLFSTTAETLTSSSSSKTTTRPSLLRRVTGIYDPKASVVPVLEKWIDEGADVTGEDLQILIGTMTKFRRFHHALQISQWMTDRRYFDLTSIDTAIRLKLIYNVHGLEQTEKYFDNISKQLKTAQTYGALLNCYVKERCVEKAEAIMQKMKMMGFVTSSFPYNWLMELYAQSGKLHNIDMLLAEMEEKGIPQDKYTLTNRLIGYIAVSDVEGMDRIVDLMLDPSLCIDWSAYAVAARGYLKVGQIDKVLVMLKKVEELTTVKRKVKVTDYLLSLYASAGKKDDVYRIWNLYKSGKKVRKSPYSRSASHVCMISSLDKLDDIEGAEKVLEEWESISTNNDTNSGIRVWNQLISVYCKRRLFEKAEMLAQKVANSGRSHCASTWNVLATGYLSDKQIAKGVEMLKKAFLAGRQGWRPSDAASIELCLEYFEKQKDVKGADEFVELLGTSGLITKQVYHWLLRIYVAASKPVSQVLRLMEADGFSADVETDQILKVGG